MADNFNMWYYRKDRNLSHECERILEEAEKLGVSFTVVTPDDVDIVVTRTDRRSIRFQNEIVKLPPLVLPRTGSGTTYYTSSVLKHLENLGVPIVNTADAIDLCKDKLESTSVMARANIPVPRTMLVRFPIDLKLVQNYINYPCVIKVLTGSYGKGVHLVKDEETLDELMEFTNSLKSPNSIIIQEYIGFKPGTDIRVLVVGGKVLGAMKRTGRDGDFKANITRGGAGELFKLDDEGDFIAREVSRLLNLDIGGIDLLIDENGYKVCEANSAPGFQGFEASTNINVAKEIVQYCILKAKQKLV